MKQPYVIPFPQWVDNRGTLVPVEEGIDLPFTIKRVFWVLDQKRMRAGHAHRRGEQVLVPLAGEVAVTIWGEGYPRQTVTLKNRAQGLYLPPGMFLTYSSLPGSVLLVLCSEPWNPDDLIKERSDL